MNKTYLLLLTLLLSLLGVQAQGIFNMTLQSNIAYPQGLNDCWGWDDGTGNEYALIGTSNSISIMNITNPASPTLVANLPATPGGSVTWRDVKTYAGYAYCTNEHGDGLRIINLNMLPAVPAYKDTVIFQVTSSHNIWIADGYAYISGSNVNPGGLDILNLSNPWYPTYAGSYTGNYVHDVYVRNDTAYACELSSGLTVINVANKANPVVIGNKTYNNNFTHNSWLSDDGRTCFTTDELSAAYIYAWDVSDPGNITELDNIRSSQSNGQATPHNTHVLNDYLVTSYYADGLVIFDGSRPHNLIEVGYYDTEPGAAGGGFPGAWGAFPFFPSGTVIGTDQNNGLFVFSVNYVRGCYLEGLVTDSVTGLPISGADIVINGTGASDLSDNIGNYATGVATPGSYTATYSKFGYVSKTINVSLANGVLLIENVELVPLQAFTFTINVVEAGSLNPLGGASVRAVEAGGGVLDYLANGAGVVTDNAFFGGNYEFFAGKWGWRTQSVTANANQGNPSITIALEKGYYDDYLFNFNWQRTGNATAGLWERGEPIGTNNQGDPYNPEDDVPSDYGDQCYVTGNGGGNAGDDDVDGGTTILTSPVMDLTTYNTALLKFYRWFANGGGFGGGPNDYFKIEVNNGISTVLVANLTGTNLDSWVQDTYNLNGLITLTNNMRIIFTAEDVPSGHLVEAALDVFEVVEGAPVGVSDEIEVNGVELNVFPNPAGKDIATVSYDLSLFSGSGNFQFVLTDITGRKVWAKSLDATSGSFLLPEVLSGGFYVASLKSGEQTIKSMKIVK